LNKHVTLCALTVVGVLLLGFLQPADVAPAQAAPIEGASGNEDWPSNQVPENRRDQSLGAGWKASSDVATTAIGDEDGFTIYAAAASEGYAWLPVTTLAVPGVETDRWIGNTCLTEDGAYMGVVYGPRTMTNDARQFDAGAWGAIVDMNTGVVTSIGRGFSLAYFNPGCGAGNDIVMAAFTETAETRLVRVNAASPSETAVTEVPFELASPIPTLNGFVGAAAGDLVHVSSDGIVDSIAKTNGVAYDVTIAPDDAVVFIDKDGETAVARIVPHGQSRTSVAEAAELARGPIQDFGFLRDRSGRLYVAGESTQPAAALPPGISTLNESSKSTLSGEGQLVVTETSNVLDAAAKSEGNIPPNPQVIVNAKVPQTGEILRFAVEPGGPQEQAQVSSAPQRLAAAAVVGDPHNPIEAERACAIPRNDPANQALQPKPRQVEWAVNQAVTGTLNKARTLSPFLTRAGLAGTTPQGLFPRLSLDGGGRVPSQIMLGIIAQESNLWQASRYTTPGVTGNPLVGNFYGNDQSDAGFTWTPNFEDADCGYGVSQVTDGMRKAGSERPGEVALSPTKQRAVALDYATNIAAGLQILTQKWNQTKSEGLTVNDGDPAWPENWFYAVWAYNTGFYSESQKANNGGAWGVGWSNNPINPKYDPSRSPFLETSYGDYSPADAANPQDWPYPEKVMGFAAWSLSLYEDEDTLVQAFRPAWWSSASDRTRVKPPMDLFCVASVNDCDPTQSVRPTAPGMSSEPSGPCLHKDANGLYDLKCWMNGPVEWKPDCSGCGNELLRFYAGYPEQEDATSFPPNCSVATTDANDPFSRGLPANALVVDDVSTLPLRDCAQQSNRGSFEFTFGSALGGYPSKIDTHQLGAGFNSHFYFAHTRLANTGNNLYGGLDVSGKWTLGQSLDGTWTRVLVHLPDHGAWTQQAAYDIDLGDGTVKRRVIQQRTGANSWVSLGVFQMKGTPSVTLSNSTFDGDGIDDIAWDAVAFSPLAGKPANIVVAMGDSFSSGEGTSDDSGAQFYSESDNNGKRVADDGDNAYTPDVQFNRDRNACHRSSEAWSRKATVPGQTQTVGALADSYNAAMDYHLIACSGALTEHVLPYHSVTGAPPTVAGTRTGEFGKYREVSQLDSGFLDENTTLVTISIGGNDARFSKIITACAAYAECSGKTFDGDTQTLPQATYDLITEEVQPSVVTVLQQIRLKAPNARVLLMGYPTLFLEGSTCITVAEYQRTWLVEASNRLAAAFTAATNTANTDAGQVYVTLADPVPNFAGQNLCNGDPSGMNSFRYVLTPGDDPSVRFFDVGIVSAQSVHPNVTGSRLYAQAMTNALK
jgi:lysophospholipase L1-like esterase